jgi:hypothetical protein
MAVRRLLRGKVGVALRVYRRASSGRDSEWRAAFSLAEPAARGNSGAAKWATTMSSLREDAGVHTRASPQIGTEQVGPHASGNTHQDILAEGYDP